MSEVFQCLSVFFKIRGEQKGTNVIQFLFSLEHKLHMNKQVRDSDSCEPHRF